MKYSNLIKNVSLKWLMLFLLGFSVQQFGLCQNQVGTQSSIQFSEGVVLDSKRNEIYISNTKSIVEGLDLTSGKNKWTSKLLGRPLFIKNDILFVQAKQNKSSSELEIVGLDLNRKGARAFTIKEKMPNGITCHFMKSPRGSFHLIPRWVGSDIILEWIYRYPIDGEYLSDEKPQLRKGFLLLKGNAFVVIKSSDLPKNYNRNPIVPAKRSRIKVDKGQQFLSKDKTHILVSSFVSKTGIEKNYNWKIYDQSTKKVIGGLKSNVSYASFVVRNSTLIYKRAAYQISTKGKATNYPLQLVWYDLTGKKIQSTVDILDNTYRGPTPP